MNNHVTDDDLILHFYGEANSEAPRIDAHLAQCTDCGENWNALQQTLKMVDSCEVPEAPEGFERVMWARVRPSLPDPKAAKAYWWSPRVWAPVAGLAAVIAVAFVSGHLMTSNAKPTIPSAGAADSNDAKDARNQRESVLLSALGEHFEQMEQLLVELKNAPDARRVDLSFEQETARDLVAAGRLYRATAVQNGDGQLAAVLEDLERVLVDVAAGPEQVNKKDLKSLRARIEDDSLLFKVRALTTAVREREKALSTTQSVTKRTL
jgi:hypothetical protein